MTQIRLNLAASPLRNRKLFYLLGGVAGTTLLVLALLSGIIFLRFSLKKRAVKISLEKVNETVLVDQKEGTRLVAKNKEAAKKDKEKVDLINSIILKKSFSWTGFFSRLEDCLPGPSYILSLAPTLVEDTRVQVRFKVVSGSLDDLLKLISNLQAQNFGLPRVESEERNEQGQLISEITVSYEQNI
jgi:hypothetical protein